LKAVSEIREEGNAFLFVGLSFDVTFVDWSALENQRSWWICSQTIDRRPMVITHCIVRINRKIIPDHRESAWFEKEIQYQHGYRSIACPLIEAVQDCYSSHSKKARSRHFITCWYLF
jgi:hypothetical protein